MQERKDESTCDYESDPRAKVFIGGLSLKATSEEVREFLEKFGELKSFRLTEDAQGRSKGFGFVEMSSDEEAQSAISKFDGQEYNGRDIRVNEAKPQEPRENRGGYNR